MKKGVKETTVEYQVGDLARSLVNGTFLKPEGQRKKGVDMVHGQLFADDFVEGMLQTIDERIETAETLKKIPDFNADFAVEQCFQVAFIQVQVPDKKTDDCYLN